MSNFHDRLIQHGSIAYELSRLCPGGVQVGVSLAEISRWKIGGKADVVVSPSSVDELQKVRSWISASGLASVVLGGTSNFLFSDHGLRAICIQVGPKLSGIHINSNQVTAEAGVWVPYLARRVMKGGLTGAEHICGIPGTLGGLVCMNGGSQRKSIGSAVRRVTGVDSKGEIIYHQGNECEFDYRTSIFQKNDVAIASVDLEFCFADNQKTVLKEMLSILRSRRLKFPLKQPNCGSVFKSNPSMYLEVGPPGSVIERLGFKGYRIGGAQVSPQHANFMVNKGNACAEDMLCLIRKVSHAVQDATGYRMETEVRFVNSDGDIMPADSTEVRAGL
ncbi:MAG: UDP-N-acetylmuramate dehydrogenase [Halomonas sp.]|nr:UDP-N-acetylmuramate dehydrogenase [Halomonas sp.]MBR2514708.1 UDP-N-acetylmuramate dehydrogenase [Halomonas sp.]